MIITVSNVLQLSGKAVIPLVRLLALTQLSELVNVPGEGLLPDSRVGIDLLDLGAVGVGDVHGALELANVVHDDGLASLERTNAVVGQTLEVIAQRLVAFRLAVLLDGGSDLSLDFLERGLLGGGYVQLLVQVLHDLGEDRLLKVLIVLVDGGSAVLLADLLVEVGEQLERLVANDLGDLQAGLGDVGDGGEGGVRSGEEGGGHHSRTDSELHLAEWKADIAFRY